MEQASGASGVSKRSKRWLTRLVAWPVLLVLGIVIVRWMGWAESRVFYLPGREAFETPAEFQDVSITSAGGLTLHGWLMPP